MANIKSAKKRARQTIALNKHNSSRRSLLRTHIKKIIKAISEKDKEKAVIMYNAAIPIIDRMANKKLIHKNKGARYKSRLWAQIRAV